MKFIKRRFWLTLCIMTLVFLGNTARGAMLGFMSSEQKFYISGALLTSFVVFPCLAYEANHDRKRTGAEWLTVYGPRFALVVLFSQWCLDRYRMISPVYIRDMAKKLNVR